MNEWKFGKVQKKYTQNLTCCSIFYSKSDALYFFLDSKFDVFFLNSKSDALFFLNSKSDALDFFHFTICHVKKFSIQNHGF